MMRFESPYIIFRTLYSWLGRSAVPRNNISKKPWIYVSGVLSSWVASAIKRPHYKLSQWLKFNFVTELSISYKNKIIERAL